MFYEIREATLESNGIITYFYTVVYSRSLKWCKMSTTLVHDGNHASFVLCKNDDQNSVEKRPPQCYSTACENFSSYFDIFLFPYQY